MLSVEKKKSLDGVHCPSSCSGSITGFLNRVFLELKRRLEGQPQRQVDRGCGAGHFRPGRHRVGIYALEGHGPWPFTAIEDPEGERRDYVERLRPRQALHP